MKIVEKVAFVLAFVGYTLRLLLIKQGSFLVFISMFSLSFIYLYFGFALLNGIAFRSIFKKSTYTGIPSNNILGAIAAGLAMSIGCLGLTFKLLHWPGAGINLVAGIVLCSILFIIVIVKKRRKNQMLYKRILIRSTILLSFSFLFMCIPKRVLFEIMYRDRPTLIKAQEELWKDPTNQELIDKMNEEWSKPH
jgi:hypothetical protein